MIRRLVAALALVAMGISVPLAPVPVHAARWADGPCTDNVGITIVIDFQELGGGVNIRCAPGPVTSGLDALDQAGITWEGTRRSPGFVCRIAGVPGPASESCGTTPPATAYWSYWLAPRGGSWCYSSIGAGNRTPPPGTIEGWSFALDRVAVDIPPPRFDPPPPIPGESPNPLRGGDCGSPATATPAPPATPATPAPTLPPSAPTNAPTSPAAPTTPAVLADPDSASTADSSPSQQASAGPVVSTAAAQAVAVSASTSTTSTAATATTTQPPTTSTGTIGAAASTSTDTSAGTNGSVPLGTVDLGDDGRGDAGFSPAAGLGLLVAAAVGGSSVWVARRRRGGPP